MDGILSSVSSRVKRSISRRLRSARDAGTYRRCLIMLNLLNGRSVSRTAEVTGVARSTVYRVVERFGACGEAGLLDRREDNGERKLDERFIALLDETVRSNPQDHGWRRPTWTREMLVATMAGRTAIQVHVTTMSRALRHVGARRGSPRPVVACPWSKHARTRRINRIRRLIDTLPSRHVAVYEDEVDVHLNPKIGLDWMGHGQQKFVMTPGQNKKRYLAGAMNARTGRLTVVESDRKNSMLFIGLLHDLRRTYPTAPVIHVILDNYSIHSSRITQAVLKSMGGRIVLHFLPPYCPQHNKIERLWQDLHAAVTRNHRCRTIEELMTEVHAFLRPRSKSDRVRYLQAAA